MAAVFLAACTNNGEEIGQTAFIGGTQGLVINFLPNSPPEKVVYGERFPIQIEIENVGEATIPQHEDPAKSNIIVDITGIYAADFNSDDGRLDTKYIDLGPEGLEPIRQTPQGDRLPGGVEILEYEIEGYQRRLSGNLEVNIRADICYAYQTVASVKYCSLSNTQSARDSICQIDGNKQVANSAGPVQLASVSQAVAGRDDTTFTLTFRHLGNGDLSKITEEQNSPGYPGSYGPQMKQDVRTSECNPADRISNENVVYVEIYPQAGSTTDRETVNFENFRCTGFAQKRQIGTDTFYNIGWVRLTNGQAKITCNLNDMQTDAIREMRVFMVYDYKESKEKTMLIQHLLDDSQLPGSGTLGDAPANPETNNNNPPTPSGNNLPDIAPGDDDDAPPSIPSI